MGILRSLDPRSKNGGLDVRRLPPQRAARRTGGAAQRRALGRARGRGTGLGGGPAARDPLESTIAIVVLYFPVSVKQK